MIKTRYLISSIPTLPATLKEVLWAETKVHKAIIRIQKLLYKGWLRRQKHKAGRQFSEGGRQLNAGFFLKYGLHERPLYRNGC